MMNPLAQIPQLEKLVSHSSLAEHITILGRPIVVKIAGTYLAELREKLKSGSSTQTPTIDSCANDVKSICKQFARKRIKNVVNATGIVLHTNMGRTPLPEGIWESAGAVASGYSTIEMDLADGKRGKRFEFLTLAMSTLVGSEDAIMLNNNAAAVFLMLKSLAEGKEVIVARGQQVQIGGGFRVPEILRAAGCKLVEVGTTNITTIDDIKNAINENTSMVLWVHTSNYKIRGFTKEPLLSEIKAILPENVLLSVDQGAGNIAFNIPEEPTVSELLKEGADLVCFSGDKILGGPQAGWVVGKSEYVKKIGKHQLMRTYRVGRAVASLMEETLIYYLNGGKSAAGNALDLNTEELKLRSEKLVSQLPTGRAEVVKHFFSLGGGSTPDTGFKSWAIKLNVKKSAESIKTALRELDYPVIAIVENDSVLLNLTTVSPRDDEYLIKAINEVIK